MHLLASTKKLVRLVLTVLLGFCLPYGLYKLLRPEDAAGEQTISELIREGQRSELARHAGEKKCPMYQEFRSMDFLHPTLRTKLCSNVEAYKMYWDGYPLCVLPNPFSRAMLGVAREGGETGTLRFMDNTTMLRIYMYKGNDYISRFIRLSNSWEPEQVYWTLKFALKLDRVTFLDIGSNIGVYSIQAAKLGLPVVSVDANIRNLLRLRLSLDAASLDATLVWNFIAADQQLKYLGLFADCNVGGAGRDKAQLPDTVPVMPLRSERLASLIRTTHVVMKMDIQGGEIDFLMTAGRFFKDLTVAAVQMEWQPDMMHGNDAATMLKFFVSRGYRVWRTPTLEQLDPGRSDFWGQIDIIWVHKYYDLNILQNFLYYDSYFSVPH